MLAMQHQEFPNFENVFSYTEVHFHDPHSKVHS